MERTSSSLSARERRRMMTMRSRSGSHRAQMDASAAGGGGAHGRILKDDAIVDEAHKARGVRGVGREVAQQM